jgi:hypothetical protein
MGRKESIECDQLEFIFKWHTRKDETWQTKELDRGDKDSPWAESKHQRERA